MTEHEPDNKDLCMACRQVWPCRVDKLRAMATQTTSPNEAEVAKSKLKAMGVPVQKPVRVYFGHNYQPPPPRPQTMGGMPLDEWLRRMFGGFNDASRATRDYAEAMRASAAAAEAFRKAAEEQARRRREQEEQYARAQRAAKSVCPGCTHSYDDHIGIRCYACGDQLDRERRARREQVGIDRRAEYCGWVPFIDKKTGNVFWTEFTTSWGDSGPTFREGGTR